MLLYLGHVLDGSVTPLTWVCAYGVDSEVFCTAGIVWITSVEAACELALSPLQPHSAKVWGSRVCYVVELHPPAMYWCSNEAGKT